MNGPRTGAPVAIGDEIRERRVIEGITMPIRLVGTREAVTVQEYNFESIQMNGKANLPDFKKLVYKK